MKIQANGIGPCLICACKPLIKLGFLSGSCPFTVQCFHMPEKSLTIFKTTAKSFIMPVIFGGLLLSFSVVDFNLASSYKKMNICYANYLKPVIDIVLSVNTCKY